MEPGRTDATLREKHKLLQDLETDLAYVRKWLELVYQHAEAVNQSHIANRKAYVSCMAASGYPPEEKELPDRPPVEISWECYVRLIALAEIGIGANPTNNEPDEQ